MRRIILLSTAVVVVALLALPAAAQPREPGPVGWR